MMGFSTSWELMETWEGAREVACEAEFMEAGRRVLEAVAGNSEGTQAESESTHIDADAGEAEELWWMSPFQERSREIEN